MVKQENRKSDRVASLNLLDYVVLGDNGEPVSRGMARTLNVSEVGLLLETHIELVLGQELLITIEFEEDLVEMRGKVVHIGPCDDQKYCSGIEFIEMDDAGRKVLQRYLKAFKESQV